MLRKTVSYWEALGLLSADCSSPCIIINTKGKQAESAGVQHTCKPKAKTSKSNRRSDAGVSQETEHYRTK